MRSITVTLLVALLAGCATGSVYKQGQWANTSPYADWDVDSAVCLQHSEGRLTVEDHEKIAQIKASAEEVSNVASAYGDLASTAGDYGSSLGIAGEILPVLGGMFGGTSSASAEETVKQEKFTECMKGKYWEEG